MGKIETLKSTNKNYPNKLLKIKDYPKTIYYEGNIELFNKKSVAIVGSRQCTEYGKSQAERFARELSKLGICIISGLALGIDTIAHINSMCENGKTIAVIASGLNKIYPTENKIVAEKIIQNGGMILSEWEENEDIDMSRFPRRNRIISGLADLILVIEAKYRSGSTITARCGFKQKKEVACIPGNINQKNSYGTNKLLQEGASLVMSTQDVLDLLGNEQIAKPQVNERFKEVYESLCTIPQTVDEISKRVNKKTNEVNEILFMLEVDGFAESLPGDKYIRCMKDIC